MKAKVLCEHCESEGVLRSNDVAPLIPPIDWFAARQVVAPHGPRLYVCSSKCYEAIKDRGTNWVHIDEKFRDVLVGVENCRWCAKYRHGQKCPTHAKQAARARSAAYKAGA